MFGFKINFLQELQELSVDEIEKIYNELKPSYQLKLNLC